MGRAGWGLFDSDQAWDALSDLSPLAGLDLSLIDCSTEHWEEGDPPIMSTEDARAHLNDGNFDMVFDVLKARSEYHLLLLFIGVSMRVGVCISKKQLRYIKEVYKKADSDHFFHFDKQIEHALKEYKCGEPYYLKDFDEDGTLLPDLCTTKDNTTTGDGEAEEIVSIEKRKLSSEDAGDPEQPELKHPKI